MNYKTKLLAIKSLSLFLVILSLTISYAYFHQAYSNFLEEDITAKIDQGKQGISEPLFASQQYFKDRKPQFKQLHQDALELYRKAKKQSAKRNQPVNLEHIKNTLSTRYRWPNTEIQLFLINRDYKVFDTTYTKDLGFDLSIFPETVKTLDLAFSNNKINISDFLSRDPLDMKYKMYSYAKVDDETILELGFIDSNSRIALFSAINALSPDLSATLYHVIKDGGSLFYFPVKENNTAISKEALYSKQYRFGPNDPKLDTDPVMQAFLKNKRVVHKKENAHEIYASIYDLDDAKIKTEYENIILKFELDTRTRNDFLSSIQTIFLMTALFSVMIFFALYQLIKREIERPFDIITERIKHSKKVPLSLLPNQHDEFYTVANEYNQLYDKLTNEVKKNESLLLVDHLTQIQNRKAFDQKIQELLKHYKRYKHAFSLLMFDIDNFKRINDSLGHHAGDQLLCDFTQLISNIIRESDFFYRTGGEEFIVLFPETSHEDALSVSNSIRKAVETHFSDMREQAITISGGLCTVKPYDTQDTLFKYADQLMYQAKIQGKNRICNEIEQSA